MAALVIASATPAACGGGGEGAGCGPVTRESLDPAYLVHVVGDDESVAYTSDPPTSGPHQTGPPVQGVVDEPLSRPVQVGILERGDVLVQHRTDLDAAAVQALEALAAPGIVVAPNPGLADPVVATAWLFKRTCATVDVEALRQFVDERVGQGPEG